MKGKMKKIIAGIATLAMAAQFAFVLPASADEETTKLYERGTTTAWSNDDLKDWPVTGNAAATPTIDTTHGLYANHNQTGYAQHTFEYDNNAVLTYKVKFWMHNSSGRDGNYAYLKLGSNLVFGYNTSYNLFYNTTGSITEFNSTAVKSGQPAYSGSAVEIIAVVNTTSNMLLSLTVGGTEITSAANTSLQNATYNTVAMGFNRAGSVSWNVDYGIEEIEISEVIDTTVYRTVKYQGYGIKGTDNLSSTESVKDGEKAASIPSTDKEGYTFDGWIVDGNESNVISTSELEAMTISKDYTLTAKYSVNAAYVHKIDHLEVTPTKTTIQAPGTGSETQDITVKVISKNGEDITDKAGMTFTWTIVGNEDDAEYTSLSKNNAATNTLSVLNGMEKSYFGYVNIAVAYDPENKTSDEDKSSDEIQVPYALLQDSASSNFIPIQGYPVSFNDYADSLIDYQATELGYQTNDTVFGWSIYGGNGSRTLTLKKDDDGDKYFEFAANGGGSSTVGVYQWKTQTQPYIVETVIKLPVGQDYGLYNNTTNNSAGASFKYGWMATMKANGLEIRNNDDTTANSTIEGVSGDEWNKVVTIADPVTKKYYVKVYNPTTNVLIGESEIVGLGDGELRFCVHGDGTIGMKSMRAYNPTLASAIIVGDAVVKVPEEGETATKTSYKATVKDTNDNVIPTAVTWSLEDEVNGVSINEDTGELSVAHGAGGNVTIIATSGAARAEYEVMLTTSGNVVTMSGSSSITIPFAGEDSVTATYTAKTIDKDGADVEEDEITYSLLQKDGITPYTTLPGGIAFDKETAKLTVSPGAPAGIVYVQAKNTEGLTNKIKVNIHGMLFDFGTDEPEEGYTQVLATSQYTSRLGFGFDALTGLTAAADSITGSAAYTFKVNVPNGNYTVTVDTTSAKILSETVEGSSITRNAKTFNVAVCDGVLDVTFDAASSISSLQIAQLAQPRAGAKPSIYSIGDSTTKNTGHPTGYDANSTSNDHRTYASWGNCVTSDMWNENFASYNNHGMAGRNAASYYREARLETVLLSIAEGDYVTINMGINSERENYGLFMEDYYVKGVLQRGGIPIILTHTPNGPVGSGYGTFDTTFHVTRDVATLRNLAAKYDLALIEVDTYFENYFNSLLEKDFDTEVYPLRNTENEGGKKAGYEAPTDVLGVVQTWYPDHNHYTVELGTPIATYIMGKLNSTPTLDVTATNAADFTVKVNGVEKSSGELAVGDVITITPKDEDSNIMSVNAPFSVSDGVAKYTVKVGDEAIKVSDVTIGTKPLTVTFDTAAVISGTTVTFAPTVTGTGDAQEFNAYVAEYDGTALKSVKSKTISISKTSKTDTIVLDAAPTGTVKAFVWDKTTSEPLLTNTTVSAATQQGE